METKKSIIIATLKELEIEHDGRMGENKLYDLVPEEHRAELDKKLLALVDEKLDELVDEKANGDDEEAITAPSVDAVNTDPVPSPKQDPQPQPQVTMKGNLRMDGKVYEKDRMYHVSEVIQKKMQELGVA